MFSHLGPPTNLSRFNKSHRRPTGLAAAADQAKSQHQKRLDRIYSNFHGLKPARVSLITKTCVRPLIHPQHATFSHTRVTSSGCLITPTNDLC